MTEKSTRGLKPAKDQMGSGLDYMRGDGVNRDGNRFAGNHHMKTNPDALINKGRGPTKGNQDYRGQGGPSATKDPFRAPLHTSEASGRQYPKNVDAINYGKQERTPGGTRAWAPSAGQNYNGNPDKINIQPKGTQGMGQSQSTNPIALSKKPGNPDGLNYGPKKQY